MIEVPPFDTDALLQWADQPMPDNLADARIYYDHLRQDVIAAAEHIEVQKAAINQARQVTT